MIKIFVSFENRIRDTQRRSRSLSCANRAVKHLSDTCCIVVTETFIDCSKKCHFKDEHTKLLIISDHNYNFFTNVIKYSFFTFTRPHNFLRPKAKLTLSI